MIDNKEVKELFRTIAARYNSVNSVLSFGQDKYWRKTLAKAVAGIESGKIADLASGSGALAFALAQEYQKQKRPCEIVGYDFCRALLDIAEAQTKREGWTNIRFEETDAHSLGAAEASFDAVTIGFGLRNFADRPRAYAEVQRVLKPQGWLFVLEFSQPQAWLKPFFRAYQAFIPAIAALCGTNGGAYGYLNRTVTAWPDAEKLSAELTSAGFRNVSHQLLTGGIVALHRGQKPKG